MEKKGRKPDKLSQDYVKEFIAELMIDYPKDRVTPRRKITGFKLYVLREQKRNPRKTQFNLLLSPLNRAEKFFKWF